MPVFKTSFVVDAPLEAVSRFHNDTRALRRLTPPPVLVQYQRVDPLAEGSISVFTMWFGPVPVKWTAEHSGVSVNGFTDTQVRGPLKHWRHRHRFEAMDAGHTRVSEHIDYEYPDGLRGLPARVLFSQLGLRAMFAYRAWATRRAVDEGKR